jgi:hypothetical protein
LKKAEALGTGENFAEPPRARANVFLGPVPKLRLPNPSTNPISEQSQNKHIRSKDGFERTIPKFDNMNGKFERTIPRLDSEIVKTGVKIGNTDGFEKVSPRILNNLGGPQHAENKTVQKNSFSKRDEACYILL